MVTSTRRISIGFLSILWVVGIASMAGCSPEKPPTPPVEKPPPQPLADQRNLIPQVRLSQDDINAGQINFDRLFYAGKHIFSNRFNKEDHHGEGENGPRRSKQEIAGRGDFPFLRFNGLDSQSCLECHLAIGFAAQPSHLYPMRFAKQPGLTAGGAGFGSNAFGFRNFGCKDGVKPEDCDPEKATVGVTRSPPHAFGAGYTQKLAQEMTVALQRLRKKAVESPGAPVELKAKGVTFGEIVADSDGNIDTSKVKGIRGDLVVRPFQWRGLTSNLRNFITGAMNFHFSVQPTETISVNAIPDDMDGKVNEIDEGSISAVAVFLAHLRPPAQYSEGISSTKANRGEKVFKEADCATCHVPSLKIDSPFVTVRDPRNDSKMMEEMKKLDLYQAKDEKREPEQPSLTVAYDVLPVMMEYSMREAYKAKKFPEEKADKMIRSLMGGFTRSLNRDDGPPETLPRLPSSDDGTIDVPLFSDLKRHKMGEALAEPFPQMTDGGIEDQVPGDEFLTRALWGVADTGPWMHDGRALSLTEAIEMHASEDSEANASVEKFISLSKADKKALITFLSTLRLPIYYPDR